MKRLIFTIALGLLFFNVSLAQNKASFRTYLRLGNTLAAPTMEELEYPNGWEEIPLERSLNTLNIGVGGQLMYGGKKSSIGIDVGFSTLFDNKVKDYNPGWRDTDYRDTDFTLYILLMAEKKLGGGFFAQGGLGLHAITWVYVLDERFYRTPHLSEYKVVGGTYGAGGIVAGFGYEKNLNDKFGLFVMGKLDMIFIHGVTMPVTVNLGLKF